MGLKVLIVDDDFINRRLMQMHLKKSGIVSEILEAQDGSEALNKLKNTSPVDLILLDIMMPILDGVEFLKIFRSEKENLTIPIIVLSTDDTRKDEIFDAGANDFLRKPMKEEVLIEKLKQWTQ